MIPSRMRVNHLLTRAYSDPRPQTANTRTHMQIQSHTSICCNLITNVPFKRSVFKVGVGCWLLICLKRSQQSFRMLNLHYNIYYLCPNLIGHSRSCTLHLLSKHCMQHTKGGLLKKKKKFLQL